MDFLLVQSHLVEDECGMPRMIQVQTLDTEYLSGDNDAVDISNAGVMTT